jgi:hypothetical protein
MQMTAHSEKIAKSATVSAPDWVMLHQLCAEYWLRLDRVLERPVAELYAEDGEMKIGTLEKRGRAALAEYFASRIASEEDLGRLTRHVMSSFFVEADGPDAATVRSTVLVFSGEGTLPLPSAPPSSIGDFTDQCVRCADGQWRFARRYARVAFVGAGAASFVR